MSVEAVLLVPAEGDPHGLLREGPCGARAPTVWLCQVHDSAEWVASVHTDTPGTGDALALAWEGAVVEEGCLRIHSAFPPVPGASMDDAVREVQRCLRGVVRSPTWWGRGTILLLDELGSDVTP